MLLGPSSRSPRYATPSRRLDACSPTRVVFQVPAGITIATPTHTEIMVSGADKQQVGEVAAKIRAYRKPEPYKGKGIRYSGEKIIMKEAKKA
mgnify:CR=1 FL=1